MTDIAPPSDSAAAASQLLGQQERALRAVQKIRDDLASPMTKALLKRLPKDSETEARPSVAEVLSKMEDALRAIQFCQSELHREVVSPQARANAVESADALPDALRRFIANRQGLPGFTHELHRDPVRGWVIHWKEYTEKGTVRGAGYFYERPYAWLDQA